MSDFEDMGDTQDVDYTNFDDEFTEFGKNL